MTIHCNFSFSDRTESNSLLILVTVSLKDSNWCALDRASSLVSVSRFSFSTSCFFKSLTTSTAGLALPSMVSEDLLDLMGDIGTTDSICPLNADEALLQGLCLGDSSASDIDPTECFFPLELK